jgi:predicted TPR repeat methyltransferase
MNPSDIGKAYDQITHLWESDKFDRTNGIEAHKRAIAFAKNRGGALDVGSGCSGRFIDLLIDYEFTLEGVDVSNRMVGIAQKKHPEIKLHHQDICKWAPPNKYDFITAWDSLWHIPLSKQENVLDKLFSCLNAGGVLIFSCGGTEGPDEHKDDNMGPEVYYSSLSMNGYVQLLIRSGCIIRHIEYDHYPELHAYFIVQKL